METEAQYATTVLRATTQNRLQILRKLAEFWKIPYTVSPLLGAGQAVISSGKVADTDLRPNTPLVISPAGAEDARRISEKFGLQLALRKLLVSLPYSSSARTSIVTELYEFRGSELEPVIESGGKSVLSRIGGTNIYLLSIDLASEYHRRIVRGLEDTPSKRFRLATTLPLSYKIIPSFIRNRAFRSKNRSEVGEEKLGPVECLQTIFLASIVTVSKAPVPRIGFWRRGKKFALAVSHDVETKRGLQAGSKQLLRIEEEVKIRSTWNITSNRYQLTRHDLHALAESGEIGGHDTEHDGRLIFLPLDAQVRRLRNCKETLERVAKTRVSGFRAPLLQHDKKLIEAVGKAGYEFDSSVPSWELLSPSSLKPHGVGTIFPFEAESVIEVPVTLPQDHQLLRIRNLTPSEASNALLSCSKWIREIGGLCTLLVHPDYDFALESQGTEYSRILRTFRVDPHCEIFTLREAAAWWSFRRDSYLETTDGELRVRFYGSNEQNKDLDLQVVTSYGPHGFTVEHLN